MREILTSKKCLINTKTQPTRRGLGRNFDRHATRRWQAAHWRSTSRPGGPAIPYPPSSENPSPLRRPVRHGTRSRGLIQGGRPPKQPASTTCRHRTPGPVRRRGSTSRAPADTAAPPRSKVGQRAATPTLQALNHPAQPDGVAARRRGVVPRQYTQPRPPPRPRRTAARPLTTR